MCAAGKLSQHISMLVEAQPSDNRETTRQKMKRVQVCLFAPTLYYVIESGEIQYRGILSWGDSELCP